MKIHEYQAKKLLEKYGLPTPKSIVTSDPVKVKNSMSELGSTVVIKAQVHVGGRGKAGGVKIARTPDEAFKAAQEILGMDIKGIIVKKVLVAEAVDIKQELYIGITVDRSSKKIVFMASKAGGVDIEEVASNTPEKIEKIYIDPAIGFKGYQARQLAFSLFNDSKLIKSSISIFTKLYNVFIDNDCSIAEINPLVITNNNELVAIDSKINFDDNALLKHPEFEELRDMDEEDADELHAKASGLSFIKLDGDIGCIVNGAGLAMATLDTIKLFNGNPANFLDVGGSSNPEKIIDAFKLILKDKKIKVVLINIFGGITRCDDIANGLLIAKDRINIPVPIIIRLTGTNSEEAHKILKAENISVYTNMDEAIKKAVAVSHEGEISQ